MNDKELYYFMAQLTSCHLTLDATCTLMELARQRGTVERDLQITKQAIRNVIRTLMVLAPIESRSDEPGSHSSLENRPTE